MIKVLLVDDEKMALNYLQNLISWEYYDFQLIGATTDARQALSLFKKHRPEVLITDVKMPGMNGMELVGDIREIDSKIHILFLSAYKNFDYAKAAIRLGIDDYLIKSDIDEENFLKKMLKLKEEINKESKKNRYTIKAILEEMFKKNIAEENYKNFLEENEYIRLHKKYNYIILAKKDIPSFIEETIPQSTGVEESYDFEIEDSCRSCIEGSSVNIVACFAVSKHDLLAIVELGGNPIAEKEIRERLYAISKSIYDVIKQKNQAEYDIYYYANRMSVKSFGRYYFEHRCLLMHRYIKKRTQILEFGEGILEDHFEKKIESVTSDEIYDKIKVNDKRIIEKYIENMRMAVKIEDCMTYLWYAQHFLRALKRFDDLLTGEKSKRKFSLNEGSVSYDLRNPEEVIDFIVLKVQEVMMLSHEQKNEMYSEDIIKSMKIVRENYGNENLSAAFVAKEVGLSNSWLSTKFKDEVGIGIADYINSIRIEEAKSLFDTGEFMIYEVSEKVGFTSSQYFSKIFKEYSGVTPNQYRKKKREL